MGPIRPGEADTNPVTVTEAAAKPPIKMSDGKYPIANQADANDAWKLRSHSSTHSEAAVVAHIRRACKALGLKFPGDNEQASSKYEEVYRRLRARYSIPIQDDGNEQQETAVELEAADKTTGAMVAFMLPQDIANVLAVSGGEPPEDLHLTLAYLPVPPEGADLERLKALVAGFAATEYQLEGTIAGIGLFTGGPTPVTVALPDFPGLPKFRTDLVRLIEDAGFEVSTAHGYTPHITLAYDNILDGLQEPNIDFVLGHVSVCVAGNCTAYPLTSPDQGELEAAAITPTETPGYAIESEAIKQNKMTPAALKPHRSVPVTQPSPDGSRRCLLCGDPTDATMVCGDPGQLTSPPNAPFTPNGGLHFPVAAGVYNPYTYTNPHIYGTGAAQIYNPAYIGGFTAAPTSVPIPTPTEATVAPTTAVTNLRERAPTPEPSEWVSPTKAFVTELNGKTLITAPATTDPTLFEKAYTPNEQFLWTQGRLVGADEPNRNGAFWKSGDLELGQATVRYGPLNWLHEGKHIIGTLADAAFVNPSSEQAADAQPHIAVVAPVWKWIYPDEADVLQMASDAGKFWYSMECISKSVACQADGCGAETGYMDYVHGRNGACEHMTQRSAARRFVDPTFLGAATIVPPVRPGWADANATVMQQAASLAEKAYDDAGRPTDITASEWEQLMAQVVAYTAT